jgi:hypothetical protein
VPTPSRAAPSRTRVSATTGWLRATVSSFHCYFSTVVWQGVPFVLRGASLSCARPLLAPTMSAPDRDPRRQGTERLRPNRAGSTDAGVDRPQDGISENGVAHARVSGSQIVSRDPKPSGPRAARPPWVLARALCGVFFTAHKGRIKKLERGCHA